MSPPEIHQTVAIDWLCLYRDGRTELVAARDIQDAARQADADCMAIHGRQAPPLQAAILDRLSLVIIQQLGVSPERARQCAIAIQKGA